MAESGRSDTTIRGERDGGETEGSDEHREMVEVGSFGAPHGVHGEVRMFADNLTSSLFEAGRTLWVHLRDGWESLTVEQVRETPKFGIAEFREVEGREEAGRLRNESVFVPVETLPESGEDVFYQAHLQGRHVYMATEPSVDGAQESSVASDTWRRIGEVGGFFDTNGANDVMVVVLADGEELFVPMIEGAVAPVEPESDRIRVFHPSNWGPDGMAVPPEAPVDDPEDQKATDAHHEDGGADGG